MGHMHSKQLRGNGTTNAPPPSGVAAAATSAADPPRDQTEYKFSKQEGKTLVKPPGSLRGHKFAIEECRDCDIFVCDWSAIVTVDECVGCRVFVAPVEGSCFARTCKRCSFVVACQQWRTRECEECDVLLHVTTDPVIESSSSIRMGCFSFPSYPALTGQFEDAHIDVFTNSWSNVYDFTPQSSGVKNWSLLADARAVVASFKPVPEEVMSALPVGRVRPDPELAVVPRTQGRQQPHAGMGPVSLAFFGSGSAIAALRFARLLEVEQVETASIGRLQRRTLAKQELVAAIPGNEAKETPGKQAETVGAEVICDRSVATVDAVRHICERSVAYARENVQRSDCRFWLELTGDDGRAFSGLFFLSTQH